MDVKNPTDLYNSYSNSTNISAIIYSYTIPGLDIDQAPFLFTYISLFLQSITLYELPFDLIRNVLHSDLSFIDFFIQTLKVESGFLTIMTIFVVLSFIPLGVTIAWCCHRKTGVGRPSSGDEPINPLTLIDDSIENSIHCQRRASIFVLIIFFFILIFGDVVIFLTNKKMTESFEMTPELIQASVNDIEVFLKDTHSQIKHKIDNGFDIAVESVKKDLENIDILLGEPIKWEIIASTGIELAFDSLYAISVANVELINRIQLLHDSLTKSLRISQEAAARMEELQIQLSVLQRQCTFRDRPLCDTLRIRSFEENGIIDALKTLQEDQNIFRMKYLGELESGTNVKNLSTEVAISKSIFGNYPLQVKRDTIIERNDTLEELAHIKHQTLANAELLTAIITTLIDNLSGIWEDLEPHYDNLKEYQHMYWTVTWFISMILSWILIFMTLAILFFICNSNVKAAVLMVTTVLVICIASFGIMLFGILTLTIGGNTEIFLCDALFKNNNFEYLVKLFDKPGYIYENEKPYGIISDLLRPENDNKTFVEVNLGQAIRECEQNKTSYSVFHLDAFVNTQQPNEQKNSKQYPKVISAINSIRVSEKSLLHLTESIQTILENMLKISILNSTLYRTSISQPTPEKDLATFIDQMQRVALQIQDVATSSRMTTLGSRAKRLQASILQPLEQLRNEILYHLTALELQKDPWRKQVNQTLIHLKNIQGYLEKTVGEICYNQTKNYIKRLKDYLALDKDSVSNSLSNKTATCRPLFDVFNANRNFICRNLVDSINGLWFCAFICLFLWSIGTPIALHIITLHTKLNDLQRLKKRNSRLNNEDGNWRSNRNESPRTPQSSRTSQTPRTPTTPQSPRTPKASKTPKTPNRSKPSTSRSRPIQRVESITLSFDEDDNSDNRNQRGFEQNENNRDGRSDSNFRNFRDYRGDQRDSRQVNRSESRFDRIPRPPPVPPHPPPVPAQDYMTRQNSVRGVRWEPVTDDIEFEDAT